MMEQSNIIVEITQLPHAKGLDLPHYASIGAAGADLIAANIDPIHLAPMQRVLVPTGLQIALPHGMEAQIRARSGLALKQGLAVLNAPGTIDSDYRGEISVLVINLGEAIIEITRGIRIAQMVIAQHGIADFKLVTKLTDSTRGSGGFGSTGI